MKKLMHENLHLYILFVQHDTKLNFTCGWLPTDDHALVAWSSRGSCVDFPALGARSLYNILVKRAPSRAHADLSLEAVLA
jgi:hypothetical protein